MLTDCSTTAAAAMQSHHKPRAVTGAPAINSKPDQTSSPRLIQTADGTRTLQSTQHSETYHSKFGAVTESIEVFVKNSGVFQRIHNNQPTRVLEIGFGTGLNFILTAGLADQHQCTLAYEAFEYNLPPLDLISDLLSHNAPQHLTLIQTLEKLINSGNITETFDFNKFISLTLRLENALHATLSEGSFDAIYLDAFSSKNNPDLWTTDYLQALHKALHNDGTLTTYSVNRAFKDALTDAGFEWQKHKGPPGKREVITARRRQLE